MALQRSHSAAPCVSVDTVVRRHDAQILSRPGSFDLTADQFISRPARTRKHQSHPTVFSKRLRAPVENHSGNSTPGFQEAGYPIKDLLACTRIPVGNRLRMTDEIVAVDEVHGSRRSRYRTPQGCEHRCGCPTERILSQFIRLGGKTPLNQFGCPVDTEHTALLLTARGAPNRPVAPRPAVAPLQPQRQGILLGRNQFKSLS